MAGMLLATARSLLDVIPDDPVALQFMGLSLLQAGQKEAAISLFKKATEIFSSASKVNAPGTCELASSISLREAARAERMQTVDSSRRACSEPYRMPPLICRVRRKA